MTTTSKQGGIREAPYKWWWNPHRSILDMILCIIAGFLVPVAKLVSYAPRLKDNEEMLKKLNGVRSSQDLCADLSNYSEFVKWAKICPGTLAEGEYRVPIKTEWKGWGFADTEQSQAAIANATHKHDDVRLVVRCPSKLLPKMAVKEVHKITKCQILQDQVTDDVLKQIPTDVPILVQFHCGGFIIGSTQSVEDVAVVSWFLDTLSTRSSKKVEGFVQLTVDYSLAPEHPFPAAPMEAISALSHIVTLLPNHDIHVTGISAGANLATVAVNEMLRRNAPLPKSLVCFAPFIDPDTDSHSYHMEANAPIGAPPVLRWMWQAYLQTDGDATKTGAGSWKKRPLGRLIAPDMDKDLAAGYAKSDILCAVVTNKADPAHDEGVEWAQKVQKAGGNMSLFDATGTHWFGTWLFDSKVRNAFLDKWSEAFVA